MTTTPAALADLRAIEQQARGFLADAMMEPDAPYARAYVDAVRENRPLGSAAVRVETAITAVAFALMSRPSDAAAVREADSQAVRDAIDAGLRDFCSETVDFDMSPGMRRAATDFIMAQPGMFAAAIRQGGLQGEGL